jgi:hypothetical protein
MMMRFATLATAALLLGACGHHPDPAMRPTRTDLFTQTTEFFTPAAPSIKGDGIRLSNHVSDVVSGPYKDWCTTYRIGCPVIHDGGHYRKIRKRHVVWKTYWIRR